jgi:methylenetetrahydrofolate reductase (NADPH)
MTVKALQPPDAAAPAIAAAAARAPAPARPAGGVTVSFEFFPPCDAQMEATLWQSVRRLEGLAPRFVSVTYGADGSTRERTHAVIARIQSETRLTGVPHLTCIGAPRDAILAIARRYHAAGIRHIVALRGDPPGGAAVYQPHPQGFVHASDLVAGLRRVAEFEISVAAYPEVHPEATSAAADLDNLKRKLDAGATRAITQFCFDSDAFLRFRDRCAAAGIVAPIVAGILPITRFPQITRFAARCGATIPRELQLRFDGLDDDAETRRLIAAAVAIEQVQYLERRGVSEFHFYTLNRAELTYAICHALGLRTAAAARPAANG